MFVCNFVFTGGFFSRIFSALVGQKERRILILGLDGAGKTTILYRLQVGEVVTTIPSECSISFLMYGIMDVMFFLMRSFFVLFSYWFQCGNSDIQEPKVPSVGFGWTNKY